MYTWEKCCCYKGYWGGMIDMCTKDCHGYKKLDFDSCDDKKKCVNFDICGVYAPESLLVANMCMDCAIVFGSVIKKVIKIDKCNACLKENHVLYEHPCGCHHLYCADCLRFLFGVTNNYDIEEDCRKYGCEACPHGKAPIWCRNLGCQMMMSEWQKRDPLAFQRWRDVSDKNIDNYDYYLNGMICFACGKI